MLPADLKTEISPKQKKFLDYFPNSLFCYIGDGNKDLPTIHSEILDLTRQQQGFGIFFTVNGFHGGKRDGEHLITLNSFFCDIDYPNKLDKDPEKIKAYKNDLKQELVESGMVPSAIVETKNGFHVYWFLAQPIVLAELNDAQRQEVLSAYRNIEEAILRRFDGDPGAKDTSRVLRLPGTYHQKDPNDPFLVRLDFFNEENVYTFAEVRKAFLTKPMGDSWAEAVAENAIDAEAREQIEKTYPRLERPSYKKLLDLSFELPEGMRNKGLLVVAYACKESGWPIEKTFEHFTEYHGLSLREIRKTIRSAYDHAYDFGYNNEVMIALADAEERAQLSKATSKVLAKTTKDVREKNNNLQKEMYLTYEYVIADRYPNLLYKQRGDFYNYDSGVYKPLQLDDVRSLIIKEMFNDGLTNYRKVSSVADKIACFKSLDGRTFTHEEENPDPNILNFKNGLLNIQTYQVNEHTPSYLSTNQIPIIYDYQARAPQWQKFLLEIMDGDADQIKLLQQIAGYTLTDSTAFAKAFIFFGQGANGKSLFNRIISKLIGQENVSNLNLSTITKQFGLTGLVGKKLNIIDEISGNYFESNVIKGIISGERMSADVKFRPEPLEFTPIAKLIFSVNELPKINDTTPGLYRRFLIVPFTRTFASNPDLDLEKKLSEELPGILNWAIEGLKSLREAGHFNETEKNLEAMRSFKSDNSPVVEFFGNYFEFVGKDEESGYSLPVSEIYSLYRNYCFDNGYKPKALSNFSRELFHNTFGDRMLMREQDGLRTMVKGIRKLNNIAGDRIHYA